MRTCFLVKSTSASSLDEKAAILGEGKIGRNEKSERDVHRKGEKERKRAAKVRVRVTIPSQTK